MDKITVGIDPDGDKHGVAIYINGKLKQLAMLSTVQIVHEIILPYKEHDLLFAIENVNTTNKIFDKHLTDNKKVNMEVARKVGRNQQSQLELESWLDFYDVKYKRYKPSSEWKKTEKLFKRITGWTGRSNEDKRSAAYFGMLALR